MWTFGSLFLIIGVIATVVLSDGIRMRYYYYALEVKQRDVLLANARNGLAPLPEVNPDYYRLVDIGRKDRPFLLNQLVGLLDRKYPDDKYYLSLMPRYVAFAVADASGWSRQEVQEQAQNQNVDLERYVLWRVTHSAGPIGTIEKGSP